MYNKTKLSIDLGEEAMKLGSSYVNKAINTSVHLNRVRRYFQIDNAYVIRKISLIFFPYRASSWRAPSGARGFSSGIRETVSFATEEYSARDIIPNEELIGATEPDLYIPLMAVVSYMMVLAAEMGLGGSFHPEKLGVIGTRLVMMGSVELVAIKILGFFFEANELELLDIMSFMGYKYVPTILMKAIGLCFSRAIRNICVVYLYAAFLVFLARSLKNFLLLENTVAVVQQRRVYFLFLIVALDTLLMLLLK